MQSLINEVLQFAAPCWAINLSLNLIYIAKTNFPSLAKHDWPLDFSKNFFDGNRIFGNSTTIPGLFVAAISSQIIFYIFDIHFETKWLWLIYALGVYFGHAAGSFIKRRLNYKDGKFLIFVDHADYVWLTGILVLAFGIFTWKAVIFGIMATYIIHPIATYIAFKLSLHKNPL